jgi:hypothetical protein
MGNGTLLGVLVGGIAGYALSQIDVLRNKSFGPPAIYVGAATVAGGFVGAVIGHGFDAPALPTAKTPPPQIPPTSTYA